MVKKTLRINWYKTQIKIHNLKRNSPIDTKLLIWDKNRLTIKRMKVSNMTSSRGNSVPNQFIIETDYERLYNRVHSRFYC